MRQVYCYIEVTDLASVKFKVEDLASRDKFIVISRSRMGPSTATAQHYTRLNKIRTPLDEGNSSSDDSEDEDTS